MFPGKRIWNQKLRDITVKESNSFLCCGKAARAKGSWRSVKGKLNNEPSAGCDVGVLRKKRCSVGTIHV